MAELVWVEWWASPVFFVCFALVMGTLEGGETYRIPFQQDWGRCESQGENIRPGDLCFGACKGNVGNGWRKGAPLCSAFSEPAGQAAHVRGPICCSKLD